MNKAAGLERLELACQRYIFWLTVDSKVYLWRFFVKFSVARGRGVKNGDPTRDRYTVGLDR